MSNAKERYKGEDNGDKITGLCWQKVSIKMLLLLSLLYVVSITISLFTRLTVEKAITKPVQFKMPACARLPPELRGDEGERKYKMALVESTCRSFSKSGGWSEQWL